MPSGLLLAANIAATRQAVLCPRSQGKYDPQSRRRIFPRRPSSISCDATGIACHLKFRRGQSNGLRSAAGTTVQSNPPGATHPDSRREDLRSQDLKPFGRHGNRGLGAGPWWGSTPGPRFGGSVDRSTRNHRGGPGSGSRQAPAERLGHLKRPKFQWAAHTPRHQKKVEAPNVSSRI